MGNSSNRTIIAEPLSEDLDEKLKTKALKRKNKIQVKRKLDDVLNPSKPSFNSTLIEADFFKSLNITEEQYYLYFSCNEQ